MSVSIAAFGLAKSYWLMVVCRCIGGTLGGTISYVDNGSRLGDLLMFA